MLSVIEKDAKPSIALGHRRITLTVHPGTTLAKRAILIHEWHKSQLHDAALAQIKSGSGNCTLRLPATSISA
jgi:hypothetical protein